MTCLKFYDRLKGRWSRIPQYRLSVFGSENPNYDYEQKQVLKRRPLQRMEISGIIHGTITVLEISNIQKAFPVSTIKVSILKAKHAPLSRERSQIAGRLD